MSSSSSFNNLFSKKATSTSYVITEPEYSNLHNMSNMRYSTSPGIQNETIDKSPTNFFNNNSTNFNSGNNRNINNIKTNTNKINTNTNWNWNITANQPSKVGCSNNLTWSNNKNIPYDLTHANLNIFEFPSIFEKENFGEIVKVKTKSILFHPNHNNYNIEELRYFALLRKKNDLNNSKNFQYNHSNYLNNTNTNTNYNLNTNNTTYNKDSNINY